MSNKTISINPSLFSLGGKSKTKKNNNKKPTITPLISPNILKKKLLKRIKEHKQRETHNLDNKRRDSDTNTNIDTDIKQNSDSFSDEFSNSLNYLQTLSKQKKINDEKINYEKQKQIRKENLERKTLKHYQNNNDHDNHVVQPYVNIDLPEELKINNTDNLETTGGAVHLQPYKYDTVPYGILKGGIKPTYRTWSRTQRNNIVTNPNLALTIQGGQINREKNERENRLNNLREKLKQKHIENTLQQSEEVDQKDIIQHTENNILSQNLIQKPNTYLIVTDSNKYTQVKEPIENAEIIATKKITKKTIKRTYTLGKSNIKNRVSILVKDRGTRKNVLNAQRELKKKPINDVKTYLREHNLIKIGSNAPNDVIRKLYESAMLAGEITNSNSEILLHNYSKDDKDV
jgi:hypothetical protein